MNSPLAGLGALAPIGLDDLVARAELLVRVDRKYLLGDAALTQFVSDLPRDSRVLEIDGQREIFYRSLYHDTSSLAAYRGTAQRRRRRFKVRTREYGTGGVFLEVKTRRGAHTVKERIPHDFVAGNLDAESMAYVEERLAAAGTPLAGEVRPALWTTYRRTTVMLPDESRVTIDTGLTWSTTRAETIACEGQTVVETKSNGRASAADRALWAAGQRPLSISKYGTGLAALYPELPSNRWHRLLNTRLQASAALAA